MALSYENQAREIPGAHVLYRDPYILITRTDSGPFESILGATIVNDLPEGPVAGIQMSAMRRDSAFEPFHAHILLRPPSEGRLPPPLWRTGKDATAYHPQSFLPGHDEFLALAGQKPLRRQQYPLAAGQGGIDLVEHMQAVTGKLRNNGDISTNMHDAVGEIGAFLTGALEPVASQRKALQSLEHYFAASPPPADPYEDPATLRYRERDSARDRPAAIVLNREMPDSPVGAVRIMTVSDGIYASLIPRGSMEDFTRLTRQLDGIRHRNSFLINDSAKDFLTAHTGSKPYADKVVELTGEGIRRQLSLLADRGLISIECEIKCRHCIDQLELADPSMPLGWDSKSPYRRR